MPVAIVIIIASGFLPPDHPATRQKVAERKTGVKIFIIKLFLASLWRFCYVVGNGEVKMLKDFIEKIGRENLQRACNVTQDATYKWQRGGIIPRKYHPALEVLARDKGCFTLWKKIAGIKTQRGKD